MSFGIIATSGCCPKTGGSAPAPDDGWTVFEEQPGAVIAYVSNSGNDGNSGLSPATPKATFAAGYALLRNNQADWLLLERGSTFNISDVVWSKSGPVADDSGWMLLSYYGDDNDPRPVIDTDVSGGLIITPGFAATAPICHLAITDIEIRASGRIADPATAPNVTGMFLVAASYAGAGNPFQSIYIENVLYNGYQFGHNSSSDVENLVFRRNIITENFGPGGGGVNSSGILCDAQGLTLSQNIFYRIQFPTMPSVDSVSFFSHSAYIGAEATNVVTSGNIVIQATECLMQRAGGTYSQNLGIETAIAGLMGQSTGVPPTPGGIVCDILDCASMNAEGEFQIGNTASGSVSRNVLIRTADSAFDTNFGLRGENGDNIGVHDVTFLSNFMAGAFAYDPAPGNPDDYSGLVFTSNSENLGETDVTVSDLCVYLGLGAGDSDTYGEFLITRDRGNFSTTMLSPVAISFVRAQFGLPPLG